VSILPGYISYVSSGANQARLVQKITLTATREDR
jgi:hypothetical protein